MFPGETRGAPGEKTQRAEKFDIEAWMQTYGYLPEAGFQTFFKFFHCLVMVHFMVLKTESSGKLMMVNHKRNRK